MDDDVIKQAPGKHFLITGMTRFHFSQREALYVKGVLPGKTIEVMQLSPQGDRLIARIEGQKFAVKREMWDLLDLEERA